MNNLKEPSIMQQFSVFKLKFEKSFRIDLYQESKFKIPEIFQNRLLSIFSLRSI